MYKRVQAVVVMYAVFILVFSVLQGLIPGFDLIDVWFHSFWMQGALLLVFWFVSPLLVRIVERRGRKP
jgi:hypothetical protein